MGVFRVEKDGIAFYVQPDAVAEHVESGYEVFAEDGEPADESDVTAQIEDAHCEGVVTREVVTNG